MLENYPKYLGFDKIDEIGRLRVFRDFAKIDEIVSDEIVRVVCKYFLQGSDSFLVETV